MRLTNRFAPRTGAVVLSITLIGVAGPHLGCGSSAPSAEPSPSSPPASPTPGRAVTFPLRVDVARRQLLDAAGQPFVITGDAAWSLMVRLTLSEAGSYLDDRRNRGFNAVLVNLVEHHFGGPANRNGDRPFSVAGDLSTPNDRYFAHVDQVLTLARDRGILVLLTPLYLGYQGGEEGWYEEALGSGVTKCRQYGRYLGQRYARFANIVWVNGGDTGPKDAGAEVDAVVAGIKEQDPGHLHTAHSSRGRSALDDYDRPWLDLNTTYTDCENALPASQFDYGRSRTFFHIEGIYENEGADARCLIGQAYYSTFAGGRGHVFGNRPMWLFDNGWPGALASPGAAYMGHFAALAASREGYGLVPDRDHRIVAALDADEVAAAQTPSGASALIYVPTARRLTVDTRSLPPSLVAWRFDPSTGAAQQAGSFTGGGRVEFGPPSFSPWVLVLDDATRSLPPPGSPAR